MLLSDKVLHNACQWLIKNAGPSIRYRALTEIMEAAPESDEVKNTYAELLESDRVKYISSIQNPDGSFGQKCFHHGSESTETYLREMLEMGLKSGFPALNKSVGLAKRLHLEKLEDQAWILGMYIEPIGRLGFSELVRDWFAQYVSLFDTFIKEHRTDWLINIKGMPSTYHIEIPYMYVIRTISSSWRWLKTAANEDISSILEFLLVDMSEISNLYLVGKNKQLLSYPNFFHIVSPGIIEAKEPSALEAAVLLEDLWLLSTFGVINKYPGLKNAFDFISSRMNSDGTWEFPIKGMTKAKAGWNSYHGFSLEESWRRKEAPIAELTFRICLIEARNRKGSCS